MTSNRLIVVTLIGLAVAAFVAQLAIDFSVENVGAACIVLGSALVTLLYILWTRAIQTHPLSTFALFGFNVTTQLGALLAQSVSWVALIYGLRQPVETFVMLAMFQGIALVAHAFYRQFAVPRLNRASILRGLLERSGLYITPSAWQLWLIGLFGLLNLLAGIGGGNVGSKIANGFQFLAWAPFLIPMFAIQEGKSYCNARLHYLLLGGYVVGIALIAIGLGARGMMISGLMTISLFALLTAMRSDFHVHSRIVMRIAFVGVMLAVLSIPLADLVTAMAIAREDRGKVAAVKLIEKTFENFTDREAIADYRKLGKREQMRSRYDEEYIANPLMARFVETKFHDNALYYSKDLLPSEREALAEVSVDFLWATLPDPMLKEMEVGVEKSQLRYSMGDYIAHLSIGTSLGGYRTGSAFGQGFALFGWVFPLMYFGMCFAMFWALDLYSFRAGTGKVLVTTLGMLGIWRLFQYGITGESLHQIFMGIVRGLPQAILLYLLALHTARLSEGVWRHWSTAKPRQRSYARQ